MPNDFREEECSTMAQPSETFLNTNLLLVSDEIADGRKLIIR